MTPYNKALVYRFLSFHGELYAPVAVNSLAECIKQQRSDIIESLRPNYCFNNSLLLEAGVEGLTYTEGLANGHHRAWAGSTIHAWNTHGPWAYDFTWPLFCKGRGFYFGVPFGERFAIQIQNERRALKLKSSPVCLNFRPLLEGEHPLYPIPEDRCVVSIRKIIRNSWGRLRRFYDKSGQLLAIPRPFPLAGEVI